MQTNELLTLVQSALEDLKARDLVMIDVRGESTVTDYMVIATGTSRRHVVAVAQEVIEQVKAAGLVPIGVEGQNASDWVLVDVGDVVVHVMMEDARAFYDLERLWGLGDKSESKA